MNKGCKNLVAVQWTAREAYTVEITEVRIKLMEDLDDRLQAFCSVTLDHCFVVRDLKIIEGTSGPFVAMPSRKLTMHCHRCGCKNHLRANFCNQCGSSIKSEQLVRDASGRVKLYADIAHPINSQCREMIQQRVITEFHNEIERAKLPGYVSRYDEMYGELDAGMDADFVEEPGSHTRAKAMPLSNAASTAVQASNPNASQETEPSKQDSLMNEEVGSNKQERSAREERQGAPSTKEGMSETVQREQSNSAEDEKSVAGEASHRVEPSQSTIAGPHKQSHAKESNESARRKANTDFGAGILDD
jgi:stage V sporulation protein G